jgi:ankyrin repeat protein
MLVHDPTLISCTTTDDAHLLPLFLAALEGRSTVAMALLNAGAMPTITDPNGFTPLMAACSRNHVSIAAMLVDRDAPLEQCTLKEGWTAFHIAAANNKCDSLEFLCRNCVDFDRLSKDGKTALDLATDFRATAAHNWLTHPPPLPRLPRWRPSVHHLVCC